MPRISEFYGIVIWMYQNEHMPPHFRAQYGEYWVRINLNTMESMDAGFPVRRMRLVMRWARLHRDELFADWERARASQPLDSIDPLS